MAFLPLRIPPGMSKSDTEYATKGRWWDGNLVRWIRGVLQPVGNWTVGSISPGVADPRAAHSWMVTGGTRYVALAGGVVSNPTSLVWDPIPTPVVGVHSDVCPDASTTINVSWGFRPASPAATDTITIEYNINSGAWVTLDDDLAYNVTTFAHVNSGFYPAGEATPDATWVFVYRVTVKTAGGTVRATRTGNLTLPVKLCYHFDTCTVEQGAHVDTCPDVSSTLDLAWTLSATPPVGDHIRVRGKLDTGAWATLTDALANDATSYSHAMTGWYPAGEGQTGTTRTYSYEVLVLDANDVVVTTSGVVSKVVQAMTCAEGPPAGGGITSATLYANSYDSDIQCPGNSRWILNASLNADASLPASGYTFHIRRKMGEGGSWADVYTATPVADQQLTVIDTLEGYLNTGSADAETLLVWQAYVTRNADSATVAQSAEAPYLAYLTQCRGSVDVEVRNATAAFYDSELVCPASAFGYVAWDPYPADADVSEYTATIEYRLGGSAAWQTLVEGLGPDAGTYFFEISGIVKNSASTGAEHVFVTFRVSFITTASGQTAHSDWVTLSEWLITCDA